MMKFISAQFLFVTLCIPVLAQANSTDHETARSLGEQESIPATISDTIRTDSRMIGTIDNGIRVDPRISNGNDGIRILIEPQNYMLHRESFLKDLAPNKMAAAAVSAGESFVTRERLPEALICYEDAIQCIRNNKVGIDDGLKKRIVTGCCDLLRKQTKFEQAKAIEEEFPQSK